MKIFKNQKVKNITLGFTQAVLLWVIISVVATFINSPKQALKNINLDEFSWLIGQWQGDFGGGTFTEKWEMIDENKIIGSGCFVARNDTVFREELSLLRIGNNCGYISEADDNPPVLFTLTEKTGNKWTFENKEHDFPKKIIYSLKDDGSLFVSVEGKTFGIPVNDEYLMKKVK